MNYVITGAAGHISHALTQHLLNAGHSVTVVGRQQKNLQSLTGKGAKAAIGSVEDVSFLKKIFTGADAVYTMSPPNFGAADMKGFIAQTGKNYTEALKAAGVKNVVNLSSVGAHMPTGCGPVSGLYQTEQSLNSLPGVNILHLRPSYFYQNLLANIGLIKQAGIIGGNFSIPDGKFPIVDPSDIATVAADALLKLDFTGTSHRYIAGDEVGTDKIAAVLGKAIGKPDLQWVKFSDEQALAGMLQAGLPQTIAENYVEMGQAMDSGKMFEEYRKQVVKLGKVKLEDFAKEFASAYKAS
ncbi:MAG: NmrA family NAD(P)-binding protein [Sphingobacteriales bacterium]|nr:NmrA family NAD(P)-binding protein [Sphingobacteriales bacterium]OJW02907.1 MAG: NAD-dependent dehydratase [Sphingobacteriales bacterium 44-61]